MLVALTGYGQAEDLARSQSAGFDNHLVKPVNLERLREMLSGYCAERCRDVLSSFLLPSWIVHTELHLLGS